MYKYYIQEDYMNGLCLSHYLTKQWCIAIAYSAHGTPCKKDSSSLGATNTTQ